MSNVQIKKSSRLVIVLTMLMMNQIAGAANEPVFLREKGRNLKPSTPEIEKQWQIGFSQIDAQDFAACAKTFKDLAAKDKQNSAHAMVNQAWCLGAAGKFSEAITRNKEALKIYPILKPIVESELARLAVERASAAGDIRGAISELQSLIKLNSRNSIAHGELAFVYQQLKEYDLCIKNASLSLEITKSASAFSNRGACNIGKQDDPKALSDFNEALKLDSKLVSAYVMRAMIFARKGDCVAAKRDAVQAKALDANIGSFFSAPVNGCQF